jgi:DNA/RNA-binding domain of Phe-tRNA-synthetase-like protein
VVIVPLTIDEALKRLCPHLQIAWVQGRAKVEASSPALVALLEERAAQIAASGLEPASNPEIAATRAAYKALGKEPSRYRGSAEALARRVVSGKGLYFVNNLVDVNNLISLETLLPLGSYDLGKIGNEVVFRIGKPGESYPGIGKDLINIADLPVFADDQGAFGSPTSDSQRSMITNATTAFAMAIISFSGKSDLRGHAQRASDLLAQHASGSEIFVEIV